MVRLAAPDDIPDIAKLLLAYHAETHLRSLTVDMQAGIEWIWPCLTQPPSFTLLGPDSVAVVHAGQAMFVECIGNISIFYIKPEVRGKGLGRELLQACISAAQTNSIDILQTGIFSGFQDGGKNDKLYANLFLRSGFRRVGSMLTKDLRHGRDNEQT